MKLFLVFASIIYGISLLTLNYCAMKKNDKYLPVKTFVSVLFVVTTCISYFLGKHTLLLHFINLFIGLVFCLLGDRFLAYADHDIDAAIPYLKKGIYSFSAAHFFFIIFLQFYQPIRIQDFIIPIVLMFLLYLLQRLRVVYLRNMNILIYTYTFIVGLMTSKAIGVLLFSSIGSSHYIILTVGSILFIVSDLILLFLYFYKKRLEFLRPFNLTTYYLATFLLAISSYWL